MEKVVNAKFSGALSVMREDLTSRDSKDNTTKLMAWQRLEGLNDKKIKKIRNELIS